MAFSDHAHHGKAKEWFDAQAHDTCAFCRVTQLALLRHLRNGKIMGAFVQSQQDAWKNLDPLMADPRILFLSEPTTVEVAFRNLTQAATPSHAGWTDAYLAAFALGHLARVVTFNRGFSRFDRPDLQVLM